MESLRYLILSPIAKDYKIFSSSNKEKVKNDNIGMQVSFGRVT